MPSSDNVVVMQVPPDHLADMWPHVEPLLLKNRLAFDGDPNSVRTCLRAGYDGIMSGQMQLWVIVNADTEQVLAAKVTALLTDPSGEPYLWIAGLGGDRIFRWASQMSAAMNAFAKAAGCRWVRFAGRKALLRTCKPARIIGPYEDGLHLYEGLVT